jgi:hypothetical protein
MLTNISINDHMSLNSCFAQRFSIKVLHEQSIWKHDSKKRRYGPMLQIQLGLLKLKRMYINVILNFSSWLLNDYLSNGKCMSTSASLRFYVYVNSNLQKEHTTQISMAYSSLRPPVHLAECDFIGMWRMCMLHDLANDYATISKKQISLE